MNTGWFDRYDDYDAQEIEEMEIVTAAKFKESYPKETERFLRLEEIVPLQRAARRVAGKHYGREDAWAPEAVAIASFIGTRLRPYLVPNAKSRFEVGDVINDLGSLRMDALLPVCVRWSTGDEIGRNFDDVMEGIYNSREFTSAFFLAAFFPDQPRHARKERGSIFHAAVRIGRAVQLISLCDRLLQLLDDEGDGTGAWPTDARTRRRERQRRYRHNRARRLTNVLSPFSNADGAEEEMEIRQEVRVRV